jgi:hypothetical protein
MAAPLPVVSDELRQRLLDVERAFDCPITLLTTVFPKCILMPPVQWRRTQHVSGRTVANVVAATAAIIASVPHQHHDKLPRHIYVIADAYQYSIQCLVHYS